jgi:hypothetical protein
MLFFFFSLKRGGGRAAELFKHTLVSSRAAHQEKETEGKKRKKELKGFLQGRCQQHEENAAGEHGEKRTIYCTPPPHKE